MFDGLKNLAALGNLARDMPRIRRKLEEVKARLEETTVEGDAGGGAVRVRATAALRIVSIDMDPPLMGELLDPTTPDSGAIAAELIVLAVNEAIQRARSLAESELAKAAQELGLPVLPGGLAGLLG